MGKLKNTALGGAVLFCLREALANAILPPAAFCQSGTGGESVCAEHSATDAALVNAAKIEFRKSVRPGPIWVTRVLIIGCSLRDSSRPAQIDPIICQVPTSRAVSMGRRNTSS